MYHRLKGCTTNEKSTTSVKRSVLRIEKTEAVTQISDIKNGINSQKVKDDGMYQKRVGKKEEKTIRSKVEGVNKGKKCIQDESLWIEECHSQKGRKNRATNRGERCRRKQSV